MKERKKAAFPSLGSLAFVEAHKHYLTSQEDILAVSAHLFRTSTLETLLELKNLIEKQQNHTEHKTWMERLIEKAERNQRLVTRIRFSKFTPHPVHSGVSVNSGQYIIEIENARIFVREKSSDKYWVFEGEPDNYEISHDDGAFERGMLKYIIFLWRDLIKTYPDTGVNYEGLEELNLDGQEGREFLEGLAMLAE